MSTRDVGELIASLAPERLPDPAEVALARERLEWRRRAQVTRSSRRNALMTPWRVAGAGIAAALVVTGVVAFTPQGSSAAAAFLAQFRPQQVSALPVTEESQGDIIRALNSLSNLGTVQMPGGGTPTRAQDVARGAAGQTRTATLAEAATAIGLPKLPTPDPATLPAGVDKTPTVKVSNGSQFRFTFDKNKARTYYQSVGHPEVNLPDKFDGATLIVNIPAAAILDYAGPQGSRNNLVVAEAGELEIDVQGNVTLPELRDFLLGLPGLPPTVVSQLKSINNWSDTLPIPVPIDYVNWQSTTINGSQGLLLDDNSGIGSAAIWHANGHLFGVAGTLKARDLKVVADSLAVR